VARLERRLVSKGGKKARKIAWINAPKEEGVKRLSARLLETKAGFAEKKKERKMGQPGKGKGGRSHRKKSELRATGKKREKGEEINK